jgi:predicted ATPase/DNA-binding XRE family transcriptional regulator
VEEHDRHTRGHTGAVDSPDFGQLLVRHRALAGLTQEQLAERAGLSVRGLRYLERAERIPYPDTVSRLAAALCLSEEEQRALVIAATSRGGPGLEPIPCPEDVVGRAGDVDAIVALLSGGARLVTVTGPGGVGKTTVATEVGRRLDREYARGTRWAALAQVSNPADVPGAVWRALDVPPLAPDPLAELAERTSGEAGLLLLDNMEHLIEAGPWLADLLDGCRGLQVVVTSRLALQIRREHEYQLATLPLPAAAQVFEHRARRVDHRFAMTAENAAVVEAICRRLDGLPLALELAAARVRVLEPAEILHHLDHPLELLTNGPHDAPDRQRSLRATVAWSYGLLGGRQRRLLNELGVFAGSGSLEAVRAVSGDASGLVDDLDLLVRSSLAIREASDDSSRYRLPDTIREFVAEQWAGDPALHRDALRRHAAHFARLAAQIGPLIEGPRQPEALTRLDRDRHEVRAAIDYLTAHAGTDEALRAVTAVWMYFYIRGYAKEGHRLLSELLGASRVAVPDQTRAAALLAASQLARAVGDLDSAAALAAESVALYRNLNDRHGLATALFGAGFVARVKRNDVQARELLAAALDTAQAVGNTYIVGASLHHLAMLEIDTTSDAALIRRLLEQSLAAYRMMGFPRMIGIVLATLGGLERADARPAQARHCFLDSLQILAAAGEPREVHFPLEGLADLAYDDGQVTLAVTLASAAATYRASLRGYAVGPALPASCTWLDAAQNSLDARRYAEARDAGEGLTPLEAMAVGIGFEMETGPGQGDSEFRSSPTSPSGWSSVGSGDPDESISGVHDRQGEPMPAKPAAGCILRVISDSDPTW